MNYNSLIKNLSAEALGAAQYKKIPQPFRALAFVGLLPFILAAFSLSIAYHIMTFSYNIIASSVNYLEAWLKETKKGAGTFAEAVIYAVALPYIFLMQIALSCFAIAFFLVWFYLQCFAFIASLGSTRWQPYVNTASYESKSFKPKFAVVARNTIALITFILFCLFALFFIIAVAADEDELYTVYSVISGVYSLFAIIAIPATFQKDFANGERFSKNESEYEEDDEEDDELPMI